MIEITTNVREVVAAMKRVPKKLGELTLPILYESTQKIQRIMARPGLPVRYPIKWDSEKQRRYVIAKLRREDNLPYQRTGAHSAGWETGTLSQGAFVQNLGHQAVFLYGSASGEYKAASKVLPTGQSHIHEGRWRLVRPVIDAVMARIPKDILEKFRIDVNG